MMLGHDALTLGGFGSDGLTAAEKKTKYPTRKYSHHTTYFYPNRCEYPGCTAPAHSLRTCSGCLMVRYCSPEHQKADWSAHKLECKCFKRVGVTARFYTDDEMLAKYPLDGVCAGQPEDECTICHVKKCDARMTHTRCCGAKVCDSEADYVMMSYSRDECPRAHQRFTLCGQHFDAGRCDPLDDWRQCSVCLAALREKDEANIAITLFRGLGGLNTAPMLAKDVPRHSLCDVCDQCGGRFMIGLEGVTMSKKRGSLCRACEPVATGQPKLGWFKIDH